MDYGVLLMNSFSFSIIQLFFVFTTKNLDWERFFKEQILEFEALKKLKRENKTHWTNVELVNTSWNSIMPFDRLF
jgi:hypothetical protein